MDMILSTINSWRESGIQPETITILPAATNINVIPAEAGVLECKDVLLAFCLGEDNFDERLRQIVYHSRFYCPSTRLVVLITSKWDEDIWVDHAYPMELPGITFLAFLTAQGRITPLG